MNIKKSGIAYILLAILTFAILLSCGTKQKIIHVSRLSELFNFGSTEDQIFKKFPVGTNVNEQKPYINELYSYEYMKNILQPGVIMEGQNAMLYAPLVNKYELTRTMETLQGITSIRFGFYRANEDESTYRLFIMRSTVGIETANFNTVFEKYKEVGIKNRNGKIPKIINTTYFNSSMSAPAKAMLAVWENDSIFEALTVIDNGSFVLPEYIYYSKKELRRYFAAVVAYNKANPPKPEAAPIPKKKKKK
jgi:hypothetical protein